MSTTSHPAEVQHATTDDTQAPPLPPLEPLRMFSGPGFPKFVYRFVNKLFRLDQSRQSG